MSSEPKREDFPTTADWLRATADEANKKLNRKKWLVEVDWRGRTLTAIVTTEADGGENEAMKNAMNKLSAEGKMKLPANGEIGVFGKCTELPLSGTSLPTA